MNRQSFSLPLRTALAVATLALAAPLLAQSGSPGYNTPAEVPRYTSNQLDNLVGSIALYPDALLAQVLVASTFPDQVEEAARYVRANGTAGIDDQSWDVSVKAVAHYASALNMMADKSDWTATLGGAYANQSSDVMAAVQRMRAMAAQQGNLQSNAQQQVVTEGSYYVITPTQPRVIYVPVYDPIVVYTQPIFRMGLASRYWSFGVGFPIGGWLSYDCDWRLRSVYYNGWSDAYFEYGGGWRARAFPFIRITNVYVSPRYRNVYFNRDVYRRPVNYRNVDRYAGVHRDTYFGDRRDRDGRFGNRDAAVRASDDRDNRERNNGRPPVVGDRSRDNGRDRDNRGEDRTAQPRGERPVATPDGYRNGGPNDRQSPPRQSPPAPSRPEVAVPDERRNEPRAREMNIPPDSRRTAPPRTEAPRNEPSRNDGQRNAPQGKARDRAPSPERGREAPSSRGESRTAVPRGARGERRGTGANPSA